MSGETVYAISKEQILKMAEACPTAKEVLKAGFPAAFENQDKWEEIEPEQLKVFPWAGKDMFPTLADSRPLVHNSAPLPFRIVINELSEYKDNYKISGYKLYRRVK